MFEDFLYLLRRSGLKVSLTEWMSQPRCRTSIRFYIVQVILFKFEPGLRVVTIRLPTQNLICFRVHFIVAYQALILIVQILIGAAGEAVPAFHQITVLVIAVSDGSGLSSIT